MLRSMILITIVMKKRSSLSKNFQLPRGGFDRFKVIQSILMFQISGKIDCSSLLLSLLDCCDLHSHHREHFDIDMMRIKEKRVNLLIG